MTSTRSGEKIVGAVLRRKERPHPDLAPLSRAGSVRDGGEERPGLAHRIALQDQGPIGDRGHRLLGALEVALVVMAPVTHALVLPRSARQRKSAPPDEPW